MPFHLTFALQNGVTTDELVVSEETAAQPLRFKALSEFAAMRNCGGRGELSAW